MARTARSKKNILDRDFLTIDIAAIWARFKSEPAYFWFLCLYVLFEYVRPQSIYPVIDVLPWGKVLLVSAFLLRLISKDKKSMDNPLTFAQIGFFIAALLSSIFAEYPDASFDRFTAFVNWLILYMLFIWTLNTRFRMFMMLLVLFLASFKMSRHGAEVWLARGMAFDVMGISGGPGYFGNAADLGVQMLIFIALSLAFITGSKERWGTLKIILFALMPITATMTVLGTGERGTMLGLATMGLTMVLIGKQKIRKLVLIGVVAFSIFQLMPVQYKARFQTMGQDGTSTARLRYWKRGLEMYQDHPVFGIGFSNWQRYYSTYYPGESLRSDHQEVAHSTPITVLAEMGTLGFVFFYGIALSTIRTNIRTMRILKDVPEDKPWRHIALGLNIGLIGFMVASCFVTEHEFPFLFVQSSLSAALYNIFKDKEMSSRRRRSTRRAATQ